MQQSTRCVSDAVFPCAAFTMLAGGGSRAAPYVRVYVAFRLLGCSTNLCGD